MTNLKFKSTVFTLITLVVLSLSITEASAQNDFVPGLNTTDAGITIKSRAGKTTELFLVNNQEIELGGFRAIKFDNPDGSYSVNSGLFDENGQFSYIHQTGIKTVFNVGNSAKMTIFNSGQVVIGRTIQLYQGSSSNTAPLIGASDYKLYVEKGILTEKVKVAGLGTSDWADYVFEEDYEMLPIDELEDYVKENKHLPNVPSAQEVADNGLDLAKTDATLLEKIEESHLYIIELNNKLSALQAELDAVKASKN